MGEDTAEIMGEETKESEATETDEEQEAVEEEQEETAEGEESEKVDEEEMEIVRDSGDSQAPATKQTGFQKRVNKLNAKVDTANQERDKAATDASILEEKNKLLQLRIEQLSESGGTKTDVEPNPDDFEGGTYDVQYLKKVREFDKAIIKKELSAEMAEANKQTVVTTTQGDNAKQLLIKQEAHFDRASKLGVKDYEAREDSAIEILGLQFTNDIIDKFPDSEKILCYLGTKANKKEAENLRSLLDESLVLGVAEIGAIRSTIKLRPKSKTTVANPDGELEGGSASQSNKKRGPKGATFT